MWDDIYLFVLIVIISGFCMFDLYRDEALEKRKKRSKSTAK